MLTILKIITCLHLVNSTRPKNNFNISIANRTGSWSEPDDRTRTSSGAMPSRGKYGGGYVQYQAESSSGSWTKIFDFSGSVDFSFATSQGNSSF